MNSVPSSAVSPSPVSPVRSSHAAAFRTSSAAQPRKRRHAARKTRVALVGLSLVTTGVLTEFFAATEKASAATTATSASSATFLGSKANNRWGTVQVRITVAGGKITNVTTVQLPNSKPKSVRLSNDAASILKSKVISAQSTSVDTVSGATLTSRGYLTSVQSAIDAARGAGALA